MARHDRANGVHHSKRATGGNKRRTPCKERTRRKKYGEQRAAKATQS